MNYTAQWNEVYGLDKDPVRKHVIYPLLDEWAGDLSGLSLLDLGGGNGALLHHFRDQAYKDAALVDIDEEFLAYARRNRADERVRYLKADLCEPLPLDAESIDAAFSVFVLNEIESIQPALAELARVLRRTGKAILIVTHPFLVLYGALKSRWTGEPNNKIVGSEGYFDRRPARYVFTIASATAPYFQHTFADYLNAIGRAGLELERTAELCTDDEALRSIPAYRETRDIPKFLMMEVRRRDRG